MTIRFTNVEKEGRSLAVVYERDGQTQTVVLEPNASFDLEPNDRFVGYKALPRHLGIQIDTLHLGVDMNPGAST